MVKLYNVVTQHSSLNSFSVQVMYQSKSYKRKFVSEYLSRNCMLEKISVCEIVTVLGCYKELIGIWLPTSQKKLMILFSGVKDSKENS